MIQEQKLFQWKMNFITLKEVMNKCLLDSDCEYQQFCNIDQNCEHKGLWPVNFLDIIGYLLASVIIGISTVGGLGGGIEKMPILMILLNYSQKTATYFTYALMFGSNLANFALLIPQRNPERNQPIIDYDISLILLPTVLFGSAIGSILNVILPDIILLCVKLMIVLMFSLTPSLLQRAKLQKAIDMKKSIIFSLKQSMKKATSHGGSIAQSDYDKFLTLKHTLHDDQERLKKGDYHIDNNKVDSIPHHEKPTDSSREINSDLNKESVSQKLMDSQIDLKLLDDNDDDDPEVMIHYLSEEQKILHDDLIRQDSHLIPWKKFLISFVLFLIIEFFAIMRGGRDVGSFVGIKFCSSVYWASTGLIVVLLFAISYGVKIYVSFLEQKKRACRYFNNKIDYAFTWKYFGQIWLAGIAGGLMGGMTGVGSGSLMVPVLIIFNIEPRTASATSGFMKLYISAASVLLAYLQGQMVISDIIFFTLLALISSAILSTFIYYIVNKYRQQIQIFFQERVQYLVIYIVVFFLILNVFSGILYIIKETAIFPHWHWLSVGGNYC